MRVIEWRFVFFYFSWFARANAFVNVAFQFLLLLLRSLSTTFKETSQPPQPLPFPTHPLLPPRGRCLNAVEELIHRDTFPPGRPSIYYHYYIYIYIYIYIILFFPSFLSGFSLKREKKIGEKKSDRYISLLVFIFSIHLSVSFVLAALIADVH